MVFDVSTPTTLLVSAEETASPLASLSNPSLPSGFVTVCFVLDLFLFLYLARRASLRRVTTYLMHKIVCDLRGVTLIQISPRDA